MRCSWMVEWHSRMLVTWQNGSLPSNFLRNVTFAVISTTEILHSKPQTKRDKKDFWTPEFSQDWVFGITCWSKLLFPNLLFSYALSHVK